MCQVREEDRLQIRKVGLVPGLDAIRVEIPGVEGLRQPVRRSVSEVHDVDRVPDDQGG
jgi:hypothetical protein